jgi:galactose mutarotase-like enzyme
VTPAQVLTIASSELSATFAPDVGMLGTSIAFRGEELLDLSGGVARYAQGYQTGLPILAPWANRLGEWRYEVDGVRVDLQGMELGTDPNGLPIHGTLTAASGWDVLGVEPARLRARFDYGARHDLLRAFPFPHELVLDVAIQGCALVIGTTVRATGDRRVPVSFGWHPYLRLPHAPRRLWQLALPDRVHLELDDRSLPTGASRAEDAEADPVGDRVFDDLYALDGGRTLAIEAEGVRIAVHYEQGYPFAQVFAPPDSEFLCLEPMTAPTNALLTGACALVEPGEDYTARFAIEVGVS